MGHGPETFGHRRPSSSADPHSPVLSGEDVSPLEKRLRHPSGAHLPQRAKQLPGPGDPGRPGLCGLPHRPEMASERHQLSPEHTSGKSWKGFTVQQFLHCPSHPCTHRSRLEGLGPSCSRDPLGQPPSHQHPLATVPAASGTASAAAAPSTENVLPEYKFLPLSAFPMPLSSLPPFISMRFRQRWLLGEFGNQQMSSFTSCLSFPTTKQPGAHGAPRQTREAGSAHGTGWDWSSVISRDRNRPTNYLWPLDATMLLSNYNNYHL